MKKLLALALILGLFGIISCKKKEEQQSQQQSGQQASGGDFKAPKKKNGPKAKGQKPAPSTLKVYQEQQLVKTVNQGEYSTMATSKIKIGARQMNAITVKELISRMNLKPGKTVTLAGQSMSAQLTWEQANAPDLYVYVTPKQFLKIQPGKSVASVKFPKRLDAITVSATEVAGKTPDKKPSTNQ